LKVGPAPLIQDYHFAVEHESVYREPRHGTNHLGKTGREIVPVPGEESRCPATTVGQQPVPIEFELEDPGRIRKGAVPRFRQHQRSILSVDFPFRRAQAGQFGSDAVRRGPARLQVFHRKPGENRFLPWKRPRCGSVCVALLDQKPLLFAFLQLHQGPDPVKLEAPELEQQLAFSQSRHRILHRYPPAPIPHDHGARPVVSRGNEPFEVAILQRMIFHQNRQALVRHVVGGALGNRPGTEHPIHLEAKIEVEIPGGMLVDHEQSPALIVASRKARAGRLWGTIERTLSAVRRQGIGFGFGHDRKLAQSRRVQKIGVHLLTISLRGPALFYLFRPYASTSNSLRDHFVRTGFSPRQPLLRQRVVRHGGL
jgi:hypothetical protein